MTPEQEYKPSEEELKKKDAAKFFEGTALEKAILPDEKK